MIDLDAIRARDRDYDDVSGESYDWKGAEDRAKAAKGAAIGEKARAAVLDDDIPF